jgi:hypothetical protein
MRPFCLLALVGVTSATGYWWDYKDADCGNDDIAQPACQKTAITVGAMKACCSATVGCGGFNLCPTYRNYGVYKKTDCLSNKQLQQWPSCDLYVIESQPQPPTPAPPPTPPPTPALNYENFPPIWPLPANFTNGTATVAVAGRAFAFRGTASRTMARAYAR